MALRRAVASLSSAARVAFAAERADSAVLRASAAKARAVSASAMAASACSRSVRAFSCAAKAASETTQEALRQLIQVGTSAGWALAKAFIAFNPATSQIRSGQLTSPEGFQHWMVKLDGVVGDPEREVS